MKKSETKIINLMWLILIALALLAGFAIYNCFTKEEVKKIEVEQCEQTQQEEKKGLVFEVRL